MSNCWAGIDLGSRFIKLVAVDSDGNCVHRACADTGHDPLAHARALLRRAPCARLLATGYGRGLLEAMQDTPTVTEIKAHARGAWAAFPDARTVLDIGGQDCKVIAVTADGKVRKFEMNDRCAAGTGKFLEVMARALAFELPAFGAAALQSRSAAVINSMCTVFAEAEVTSLIARGEDRHAIARGLLDSIIARVAAMLQRVAADGDIVFTGGVATGPGIRTLLARQLGRTVVAPEHPQFTGAFGAALLARDADRTLSRKSSVQHSR